MHVPVRSGGRRPAWVLGLLGFAVGAIHLPVAGAPTWRERQFSQASARSFVTGFAGEPLVGDPLRPADRSFLTRIERVARDGVKIAERSAARVERAEVRSLALQMQGDYRTLVQAVDALSRRKGGSAPTPEVVRPDATPAGAEKSGAALERALVGSLIHLSDETLAVFEQAASDARDSDLREFAAAQLPVFRAHRTALTEVKRMLE